MHAAKIMRVSVSGKQFIFPRICACCGGFPLTHLSVSGTERNRLSRTQGWLWEIPYCIDCRNHVKATERVLVGGILAVAVAGVIGFATWLSSQTLTFGLWSFAGGIVLSSLTCWVILVLARRKCSRDCWGLTRAVLYLGSVGTFHSFEIKPKFYASEFVRANHRKLVNATPQVVSVLRGLNFGEYQVARRMIRRRK